MTYYKNAFEERCEKYTFKAYEFDSRQATHGEHYEKRSKRGGAEYYFRATV